MPDKSKDDGNSQNSCHVLLEKIGNIKAGHLEDSLIVLFKDDSVDESQESHHGCQASLNSGALSSDKIFYLSESKSEPQDNPQDQLTNKAQL